MVTVLYCFEAHFARTNPHEYCTFCQKFLRRSSMHGLITLHQTAHQEHYLPAFAASSAW